MKKIKTFTTKPLTALAVASAIFSGIAGLILFLHWNGFPSRVTLHFVSLKGADLFGTRGDVATLWGLGIAVAAVNLFLAEVFYDRSRELSYLFGGVNVLLMFVLLVSIGTIVAVN
ncbi:MAG: hypothetical protein HYU81_00135 [Candidatus Brennerbacteria bacterium]|nr:hypothetical protein [Candidatus Brennerbacteria bacterium]